VEAKVMCFYRRRDLPNPLIMLADKHQSKYIFKIFTLSKTTEWLQKEQYKLQKFGYNLKNHLFDFIIEVYHISM
jgi:hypothetical protein